MREHSPHAEARIQGRDTHFRREPDDPVDYDLSVNTGSLSLEEAAKLVAAAYRARFSASKR